MPKSHSRKDQARSFHPNLEKMPGTENIILSFPHRTPFFLIYNQNFTE